jgi:hypothetical protein
MILMIFFQQLPPPLSLHVYPKKMAQPLLCRSRYIKKRGSTVFSIKAQCYRSITKRYYFGDKRVKVDQSRQIISGCPPHGVEEGTPQLTLTGEKNNMNFSSKQDEVKVCPPI